ncbi:MAG: zinc ABC transporter substrate-binding protein [Pseudomonadota bacterium]
MHRSTTNIVCFLLFSAIIFARCSPACADATLKVITSIFPFQEFAREVGKELVDVHLLLPPGVEAHSWEPAPSDILKVSKADVFIYVGAGMEPYINNILRGAADKQIAVIDASKIVPLLNGEPHHVHETNDTHHHSGPDPHLWLDLDNDIKIVKKIAEIFSSKAPQKSGFFTRNAELYIKKLKSLDAMYIQTLKLCNSRSFVFGGHAAFGYLAKRYSLSQIPLYGINPDSEPTPARLAKLVKTARQEGVKYIYFEEMVSDKLARVIAQEIGGITLVLNPGVNLTKKQTNHGTTFLNIMMQNLENLKKGLGCDNR